MKRGIYFIFVVFVLLAVACNKDDISVFNGKHQIYFDKFYMNAIAPGTEQADTTKASFFFYPDGTKSIQVKLAVQLSGTMLDSDLHFGLKAIADAGTAQPDEYTLEDEYTFHARSLPENAERIQDTVRIRMNKSRRLDDLKDGVRLVLEIVPTDEVHVGQFERSRAVIHLTKDAVRPLWWTREVEAYLLGSYSSLKYKTFLENVPGAYELDGAMIENHPDQALKLVRAFKAWLAENPVYDTDNYEWMSVNV